jgi:4-amino-4-deoxy-L-arabinose transferase-like glycosyltransferase
MTSLPSIERPTDDVLARAAARTRSRVPLAALLVGTGLLYLVGLSRSGYANEFYAAAVRAGTQSWRAFLFGSLDPSNYITVDKPPASLWVMELSGRLFGFSSWSLLVPQALEGVAAVALLYATVRRWFSPAAALLSGAVLALAPVAALMFRFDNPDALLTLLLVAAAWATTVAIERGGARWLALAGAAIGFAFLTKMLEAFLVVPALGLAYLVAAPGPFLRRVRDVLLGLVALVVAGGWWVAVVELTPASARPYVGGSTDNSILDLIWGYNGVGRLSGQGPGNGASFSGTPGILRLFNAELGGEISWLLPAAAIALLLGVYVTATRPRTDRLRAAIILWGGWLVLMGGVFSYMGGVIHSYYAVALAPAVAVPVGVGAVLLWEQRARIGARLALAAMVIASAAWGYVLLDRTPAWHPWLRVAVLVLGLGGGIALVAAGDLLSRPWPAALAAALLFASVAPSAGYALATAATPHTGSTPSSGPGATGGFGGGGGARTSSALASLIEAGGSGYTWAAATASSMTAAPLELATGKAVMAIGGFNGGDQAITLARFKQLVAAGKIHYYVAGGGGGGFGGPGGGGSSAIESWVASTFTAQTAGGTTVYDLSAR